MPNKQFVYCKVCRLSHNQGKGHKFSTRHRQRLDSHLSKALAKIQDISFFLSTPTFLRHSDRCLNSFWCSFCDTTITELDSTFACSNTLRHLASASHFDAVKKFWYENGAEAGKRHFYSIESEELAKWEDACKALSTASTSMELAHGAVNNIPSACSSSVATCFDTFSVACCMNLHTSDPLPLYKDGNSRYNTIGKRTSTDYGPSISDTGSVSKNNGAPSIMGSGNFEQHLGLTCVRLPPGSGEGNVHSGAPPPWLQMSGSKTDFEVSTLHDCSVPLSRSKERRLKKLRNPKRVGAAWADKRRAEMEREAATCQSLQRGLEVDKGWLPNFGGVWQSGSRRETRKEFEAQRRLSVETFKPEKIKAVQPYISKKQRLKENANMETLS